MSCFLSDALPIFGVVAVFGRAFAERGFCRAVLLSFSRARYFWRNGCLCACVCGAWLLLNGIFVVFLKLSCITLNE